MYSEYGKTLFEELKLIWDIARKDIQQAQSSQKRQYDKASSPVSVEVADIAFVKVQPKFKLDHNFHGQFCVHKVTGTNAKIKPVTNPDVKSRTVPLQQVLKCRGSFPTNQSWLDHNITKPRRRRTVRKRISKYPTSNVNPGKEQTNVPGFCVLVQLIITTQSIINKMSLNYNRGLCHTTTTFSNNKN